MIHIVGAGLGGLSAAIALAGQGEPCTLISLQPSERAQSVLAEGGINAALNTMGQDDSPAQHAADTLRGGADLADPAAVADLTDHAPEIVEWLVRLGAPLQREDGRTLLRYFGGQKKKRAAYAKSSTGKVLMTALIDEARKYEARGLIRRMLRHRVIALDIREGRCFGLAAADTATWDREVLSGPVILASGGLNGLFPGRTTGSTQNLGELTALAFAGGAELGNLEMIQYHPTTVGIPGKRMLVSEAARAEGGRLFLLKDGAPWYFMEDLYPELGNLMPRDVVSRTMVQVLARPDCAGPVCLDMTGLPEETWAGKLSDLREELMERRDLDPALTPLPVAPGIHFFMGGILVDRAHRSSVRGLYAAGECACQYHGANRLGGNSMLGALYGGRVAAQTALAERIDTPPAVEGGDPGQVSPALSARLGDILAEGMGILRDEAGISGALAKLEPLLAGETRSAAERDRLLLGKAMLLSALARRESRGAHFRTDYPHREDGQFRRTAVARREGDEIKISFRDVPEGRAARGDHA